MPMRNADQIMTTFTTYVGIYHLLSRSFGKTNAPSTFQHALNILLPGLK